MKRTSELRQQIRFELKQMASVAEEMQSLLADTREGPPDARGRIAGAALLVDLYMGVENTLKRIARASGVEIAHGPEWHASLLAMFSEKEAHPELPVLFDEPFYLRLTELRRFRHVAIHGYGLALQWDLVREALEQGMLLFNAFQDTMQLYLAGLLPEDRKP